jgi:hypothetical protein
MAIAAGLLPLPATARETTREEACTAISVLAGALMISRQRGTPRETIIDMIPLDDPVRPAAEAMVEDIFAQPIYRDQGRKQRAAIEYQLIVKVGCDEHLH